MIAASSSQIPPSVKPKVFMCLDGIVTEYDLSGDQRIGRASGADVPEIVIANRHVSRRHGQLRTDSDGVFYTADRTRNGVYLHGAPVLPGETTRLFDGDELQIPLGSDSEMQYATLVIALSWERIMLWESLIRASLDPLTGLSRRDTFISWLGHQP